MWGVYNIFRADDNQSVASGKCGNYLTLRELLGSHLGREVTTPGRYHVVVSRRVTTGEYEILMATHTVTVTTLLEVL